MEEKPSKNLLIKSDRFTPDCLSSFKPLFASSVRYSSLTTRSILHPLAALTNRKNIIVLSITVYYPTG